MHDFLPWEMGQYVRWQRDHGLTVGALRRSVPDIVREAVQEIVREVPEYVRPQDPRYAEALEHAVGQLIGQFVELMNDPGASMAETLDFFYAIGYGEAEEGRSLDPLQKAIRLGSRVAIRRLTQAADRADPGIPASVYGGVTAAIFPYLDVVLSAASRGHAHARQKSLQGPETLRRRLLEQLIGDPGADGHERLVKELAHEAGWPVPRTVAAVALYDRNRQWTRPPSLPADVLSGLHLVEPCLVVPDPEGPGRHHMLEVALQDWTAAIGPPVRPAELSPSLHWARRALDLARQGVITDRRLITVTEHLPTLVIQQHRDLVAQVGGRRLEPLNKARAGQRRHLAETLLAYLECGFNATQVAARLGLHPQTVRYRLRQLKDLFGDTIYDPALHLELQMVLRAWLATPQNAEALPETA